MSDHAPDQRNEATNGAGEPAPPENTPPPPRRLFRSRDDRIVGGVAGGLGRYFNVDPVIFRIAFFALTFVGGVGVLLYLAALLFVPVEGSVGEPAPRRRFLTIAGAVLLGLVALAVADNLLGFHGFFFLGPLPFLILLLAAIAWLFVRGRDGGASGRSAARRVGLAILLLLTSAAVFGAGFWGAAAGGGVALAAVVIAVGALLALAAFFGGARWLIVPALALAAAVGIVAAADVDVRGGHGEREYAPRSAGELRSSYEHGAGRLELDLREVDFTGSRRLDVDLGLGEVVLVVPEELCVIGDARVGAGYLRVPGWEDGGFDVDWAYEHEAAPSVPQLVVDAQVGMGALKVVHDPAEADEYRHDERRGFDDADRASTPSDACAGDGSA